MVTLPVAAVMPCASPAEAQLGPQVSVVQTATVSLNAGGSYVQLPGLSTSFVLDGSEARFVTVEMNVEPTVTSGAIKVSTALAVECHPAGSTPSQPLAVPTRSVTGVNTIQSSPTLVTVDLLFAPTAAGAYTCQAWGESQDTGGNVSQFDRAFGADQVGVSPGELLATVVDQHGARQVATNEVQVGRGSSATLSNSSSWSPPSWNDASPAEADIRAEVNATDCYNSTPSSDCSGISVNNSGDANVTITLTAWQLDASGARCGAAFSNSASADITFLIHHAKLFVALPSITPMATCDPGTVRFHVELTASNSASSINTVDFKGGSSDESWVQVLP